MPDQECNKRLGVSLITDPATDKRRAALTLYRTAGDNPDEPRHLLGHDCCGGICWNAHIEITAEYRSADDAQPVVETRRVLYPITPCRAWDGTPAPCNQVGAYDPIKKVPLDPVNPDNPENARRDVYEYDADCDTGKPRSTYIDRYTWGTEINVDGAFAGWTSYTNPGGADEFDARAGDWSGHIGVDFGEFDYTTVPPEPTNPPAEPEVKRPARVFVRMGTLVYSWYGRDPDPSATFLPEGSRPVAVMEEPTACIYNNTIVDAKGRIKKDGYDEKEKYRLFEPVYSDDGCGFYVMGTDWAIMRWNNPDGLDPDNGLPVPSMPGYIMPTLGWFDVRAAVEYDPVEGGGDWLASNGPVVEVGGSIFKLDDAMYRYLNDPNFPDSTNPDDAEYIGQAGVGEGVNWSTQGAEPWDKDTPAALRPPPFALKRLLLPACALDGLEYPAGHARHGQMVGYLNDRGVTVTAVKIVKWTRAARKHSCVTDRRPAHVYQSYWFDWLEVDPLMEILCPQPRAPAAKAARIGKCLKYNTATGKCDEYGTADFNCDECEFSISSPYDL